MSCFYDAALSNEQTHVTCTSTTNFNENLTLPEPDSTSVTTFNGMMGN